ncbi:hypothetical protein AB0J83_29360 [Actinoplanes sp. NPDC049596]|uniref:hypothetical protein n=1 Tax=unclassified Actinoplanes TaxID=2626549 RepID=UPI003437B4A1
MLARLVTGRGDRPPAFFLFVGSVLALLVADIAYTVTGLMGVYQPGSIVDLGWPAMQAFGGAAALYPSVTALSRPGPPASQGAAPRLRVAGLAVASLTAPARPVYIGASIGVITAATGADPDGELRRADSAMYAAKAGGRNRIHRGA